MAPHLAQNKKQKREKKKTPNEQGEATYKITRNWRRKNQKEYLI
jgi:hypothetical protein